MARFAGSGGAPSAGTQFGNSASVGVPTPISLKTAGTRTNAGSAADAVSVGSIFAGFRKNSPDYDAIASKAQQIRAEERIVNMTAEKNMAIAGINAKATIAQAEAQADAAEAQGESAKKGGMFSAIGSIASAALPLALSDESTKHTVDELEYACDVLRELRPVSFFYKEEYSSSPERMHYGFIAQEYQKIMPDQTYRDESLGKLCIDTSELIALLVKANQELESRVRMLEVKNALVSV